MRKKDLLREIETLNARIKQLEECVKTQDRLLDGYQKREHAVVHAMQQVQTEADRRLAEAEKTARSMEQRAKQESARLLAQTEATVAEYRDAIDRYNAALEFAAAEAAANAERFASFARGKKLPEGDIVRETVGLSEIPFHEAVTDLPDPEGNPAQLMQNIYRIQNRVMPQTDEDPVEKCPAPDAAVEESVQDEPTEESAEAAVSEEELLIDTLIEESFSEEETQQLPTVNGVLESRAAQFDNTQELSLDDLLDEIIKSGEQYHG